MVPLNRIGTPFVSRSRTFISRACGRGIIARGDFKDGRLQSRNTDLGIGQVMGIAALAGGCRTTRHGGSLKRPHPRIGIPHNGSNWCRREAWQTTRPARRRAARGRRCSCRCVPSRTRSPATWPFGTGRLPRLACDPAGAVSARVSARQSGAIRWGRTGFRALEIRRLRVFG